MNLKNQKVIHKSFGEGKVIEHSENYLNISFDKGEKSFVFPDSFEMFLKMKDENLNNQIINILNKKNQEKVVNKNLTTNEYKCSTKDDVYNHIIKLFNIAKSNKKTELILTSGDLHRALGMKEKLPTVCTAMYEAMKTRDEVLSTTPSGLSSTIKIKYYL